MVFTNEQQEYLDNMKIRCGKDIPANESKVMWGNVFIENNNVSSVQIEMETNTDGLDLSMW